MKKFTLSLSLLFAWAMSLSAQVTREQADSIVLAHLQNAVTQPYLLYVNTNMPSAEGIAITTYAEEAFRAKYACWAYCLNENPDLNGPSQHRYLFVKADNGSLLEVITHHDLVPDASTSWELLSPVVKIEPRSNVSLRVYPNPTTGVLHVTRDSRDNRDEIEVYDVMGRKQCHASHVTRHENGEAVLDISHLPAGIYFLWIQTEKGVVTQKVIKK